MNSENAIEVHDIKKSFKIYSDRSFKLKDFLMFSQRRRYTVRPVLRGISFSVKKGEAIGLIGHNGCGKSTTLKMLTKIMYPDAGTIEISGRVSSLIELGAGFHPDMSGRENIYINASIFGLDRKEIDRRLPDIIAFSELEEFIDNPVRTYSSGMYMRLAFSVAINVDADILLIDEILAVGDAGFQAKCFNRLKEIKARGVSIVIVSHSLGQIEQICERSYWIHEGVIRTQGKPRDVHPMYLDYIARERQEIADREAKRKKEADAESSGQYALMQNPKKDINEYIGEDKKEDIKEDIKENHEVRIIDNTGGSAGDGGSAGTDNTGDPSEKANSGENTEDPERKSMQPLTAEDAMAAGERRWGNGKARISDVKMFRAGTLEESYTFTTGDDVMIRMQYRTRECVEDADVGIAIYRSDGVLCYGSNTRIEHFDTYDLEGEGEITIKLDNIPLLNGHYSLDLAIETSGGIAVDFWRDICVFDVYSPITGEIGVARIGHTWEIK